MMSGFLGGRMRFEIEPPFGWLDDDNGYLDELDISE